MIHVESQINAIKLSYVRQLFNDSVRKPWKDLERSFLDRYNMDLLFRGNLTGRHKVIKSIPIRTIKNAFLMWLIFKSTVFEQEILSESIYFNKRIKYAGKPIVNSINASYGLFEVHQMVKSNCEFKSYFEILNELKAVYDMSAYREFIKIQAAIPENYLIRHVCDPILQNFRQHLIYISIYVIITIKIQFLKYKIIGILKSIK